MKRVYVLMISVILLLTCGCSASQKEPIELPEKAENSGMRAIYYLDEKQQIPLSVSLDGKQQIENGVYWHYELYEMCDFEKETEFCIYDFDTKEPMRKVAFSSMTDESGLAVNGEWRAFFSPIHTELGKDNQDAVDEKLKETTRQLLNANNMGGAEVTVTDTWLFDLDGDTVDECFFKACNCEMTDEEGGNAYCILGYVDGDSCQTLYGGYEATIGDDEHVRKIQPIICDPNGDGNVSVWVYKSGDYKSVTSFDFKDGNFSRNYEVIF